MTTDDIGPDQFICEMCGETYDKEWSDEVARAEAIANGIDPDEPCGLVCGDCYQLTPWGMDQTAGRNPMPKYALMVEVSAHQSLEDAIRFALCDLAEFALPIDEDMTPEGRPPSWAEIGRRVAIALDDYNRRNQRAR